MTVSRHLGTVVYASPGLWDKVVPVVMEPVGLALYFLIGSGRPCPCVGGSRLHSALISLRRRPNSRQVFCDGGEELELSSWQRPRAHCPDDLSILLSSPACLGP